MEVKFLLGSIISNTGSFKLNLNELCESTSRTVYNLLDNANKHLSGNVQILTHLFDKVFVFISTYNCEVWSGSLFPKISHLMTFYQINNVETL